MPMEQELLFRRFPHPLGSELAIEAVGIDAGYLQLSVMDFVRDVGGHALEPGHINGQRRRRVDEPPCEP